LRSMSSFMFKFPPMFNLESERAGELHVDPEFESSSVGQQDCVRNRMLKPEPPAQRQGSFRACPLAIRPSALNVGGRSLRSIRHKSLPEETCC
jgi:hypothetical protein